MTCGSVPRYTHSAICMPASSIPHNRLLWRASLYLGVIAVALPFALLSRPVFAAGQTFSGMLVPPNEPTVPIVVDLDNGPGRLVGRIETSAPVVGEGPILSGERTGANCKVSGDLDAGLTIVLSGTCTPSLFEGKYTLRRANGSNQEGTFRLSRTQPELPRAKAPLVETDLVVKGPTLTSCLKSNSMCLAGCPRDSPNGALLCATRCRRNLAACKARVNAAPAVAGSRLEEPQSGSVVP